MSTRIKGAEYPLSKIFSPEFDYEIPSYQRPYAWTENETTELFDDLYDFFRSESEEEQYFLGSIVLVKKDENPHAEVIDGQQRLTTLTILLAVIASKLSGESREEIRELIIEPGKRLQKIPSKPRLQLRSRDKDFFEKYIQGMDFDGLFALDPQKQDNEAQANIIHNACALMDRITKKLPDEKDLTDFGAFLVNQCVLVAVSTPTQQAAFRIFSVMNNRGMSLLVTDIIKADVIGKISVQSQQYYNDKWEEMETELGRNGFNDLFGHIRMIHMKAKAKKALQEEFKKYVLPALSEETAIDFINNTLDPYSEAYRIIKNCQYVAYSEAEQVNELLRWLNRIDNSDWVPVAMLYFVKNKDNAVALKSFLQKLERLAIYMRITSWDVNHRIDRYSKILLDIENGHDADFGSNIELTDTEKQEFLVALDSDMYKMIPIKRNYLILRLDSFVSDGAAKYDYKVLTIEHVLPQTVSPGSQWERDWPDPAEREEWMHKIGNIVPLAKRKNSQAQNYDFDVKKEKYYRGKAGIASFALLSQVLSYNEWTPEVVKSRQQELIDIYAENWDLR